MTQTIRLGLTACSILAFSALTASAQTPAAPAAPVPATKTAGAPAAPKAAPVPTTFGWYAEVVSFDAATRTLTAKAAAEPHIAARAKSLQTGDRVVLAWTAYKGEADAVRYIAQEKTMAAESGYLVRGTFLSADAKTVTFRTTVPVAAAATLGTAKPGTPVRVGAPLLQPGPDAVISTVALGKSAPARPAPVVAAKPVVNARQVVGAWDVSTSMMGNAVKLVCTFTQDGVKLGGICNGPGPLANVPAEGKVDGDDVSFGFSITQPVTLTLMHRGKLDAAGSKMEGTLDLMGNVSAFTALRK